MSYNLLSEPIRKYIRQKRWESLRPIQAAAISRIMGTDNNYVLASRTASGKTEAAFLPILSKADFNKPGVQVLYISPLIALINDQFFRIEQLCESLEISVTKWHGEASRSLKNQLLKKPNGVLLITPESIEAMFVNAPYNARVLLENLHYIVIDEIHSFLGVDRGLQLTSLLSRIQQLNENRIVTIGLSATIGDQNYPSTKQLIGDIERTKILVDKSKKDTVATFKFFKAEGATLPLELLKELYKETRTDKALIFPNSRGRTEEIAVKLLKISENVNGHRNYFSHHSSIDKEIRESIEHFAKSNERFNFCIVCTSTLELGIDIGTVDKVVQIDSTHSVASLIQRVGRSGRMEGKKSFLSLYATDEWSLLQSLACWELYKSGFIEPIETVEKPYDILLHQALSIVKQLSGCRQNELIDRITQNPAFKCIPKNEVVELIEWCIDSDYLEVVQRELIIGVTGEYIVNSREFYSVFTTEPNFKVIHSGKTIGNIPYSPQLQVNENLLLAAAIWKIKDVDFEGNKIIVIPAKDGRQPKFFGGTGNIHHEVRQEMLKILFSDASYKELTEKGQGVIYKMRKDFSNFPIKNLLYDRPVIDKDGKLRIYTFTGSKINRTIAMLLKSMGYEVLMVDQSSSFEIKISRSSLDDILSNLISLDREIINNHLMEELNRNEALIVFSKWGKYLPEKYQVKVILEKHYDLEGANDYIKNLQLKFWQA